MMLTNPPPKVIQIKLGNQKMKDFHKIIGSIWHKVLELSSKNKLVNVYHNKIEGIE